jgi:RNA polymerase sigma-70 factor (ECF subfamily)
MQRDDKNLIIAFLNGLDESFEQLVNRYLKPIYNFLYQFTKDTDSLDDLTQETFIKVWKNIHKFDQSKNFRTWLYAIAKNTAYDFLKKKKTIPFSNFLDAEGDNKLEQTVEDGSSPEDVLMAQDLEKELGKKLQQLSDSHRLILLMRYKDDFSLQEISEILNLSYNTVKSQHTRALLALKKSL